MTTTFWMLALSLGIVAAAFVVVPLVRQRTGIAEDEDADRESVNVVIFDDTLADLTTQLESDEIDEATFLQLETELKKNLLQDTQETGLAKSGTGGPDWPWVPVAMAVLVPIFAIIAYSDLGFSWGSINDVVLAEEFKADEPHGAAGGQAMDMATSVERLASRLENQPDNDQGWMLLAQSYRNMNEFEAAAGAFRHLLDRYPEDHILSAYYAESLFMADGRVITPRVESALDATLKLDPDNVSMFEIKAMDAFNRQQFEESITFFRRAKAGAAEPERVQMIEQAIDGVEAAMVQRGLTPPAPVQPVTATAPVTPADPVEGGRALDVLVEVGGNVAAAEGASVFVFAKAAAGPPMPLAVQRMAVTDLPRLVRLDESMAMIEGMGLANFDEVEIIARISSTGIANANPDDYEASSGVIDLTSDYGVIKLTIESRIRER